MKNFGVQLDQSTLYNYEAGTVNAPDPGVLWALSKIYAVSLDELIALLVSVRSGKTDGSLPSSASTNPEFDAVEDQLIHAFRRAGVDTKRRILDFVDYETHKKKPARTAPSEAVPRKKARSG